ncbi:dynein intermediate chain 3, ciliary-like [Penaeus monodon]|uniref:dynein intermediate chain 3, ciliary-like n=1 Tax=Penaeus monodon TaxID=6687 RepID=UPI0018A72A8C|nr:dynein intermediate chain 3, ciliary-like [Penaeus monodon]
MQVHKQLRKELVIGASNSQRIIYSERKFKCEFLPKKLLHGSFHRVNTETIDFASTGVNHTEGGWPRDMSTTDKDQKVRYRKKVEKDDVYIHSVLQLGQKVEHCIRQNNAIDIYEMYFTDEESPMVAEPEPIKTVNVIRDPQGGQRMVTSISFCPEGGHKIAAAYSSSKFMALTDARAEANKILPVPCTLSIVNSRTSSHSFPPDTSSSPEMELHAPSWLQCIKYNSKDTHVIAAGLYNGQVSWWDTRQGPRPVESTSLEVSHAQTVTALTWMALKARTELFTVSTDGQVLWWDTRKLSQPTDTLVLDPLREDPPNITRALTATCVEYEVSMPTKLMVATEQGKVVACNRRARSPPDRISMIYNAHIAPIYAIQRNPFLLKNFMTIGDWTIKLWAEDFKESPILWTKPSPSQMRSGCWSATRSSVLFTARLDGTLDAWDLLTSWHAPSASVQSIRDATNIASKSNSPKFIYPNVVDEGLEVVGAHDGGRLLVVGSQLGTLSLLHVPSRLVTPSDKHEKAFPNNLRCSGRYIVKLTAVEFIVLSIRPINGENSVLFKGHCQQILERETRRERVLEARHKEQRLRERVRGGAGRPRREEESLEGDDGVKQAEEGVLEESRGGEANGELGLWGMKLRTQLDQEDATPAVAVQINTADETTGHDASAQNGDRGSPVDTEDLKSFSSSGSAER